MLLSPTFPSLVLFSFPATLILSLTIPEQTLVLYPFLATITLSQAISRVWFYLLCVPADSVVRTCYYRYFHPKECLINNGVLNRAILDASGKNIPSLILDESRSSSLVTARRDFCFTQAIIFRSMAFVYPFGCTLNVARPAVAVLSTGSISFPLNRPSELRAHRPIFG
ncbi:Intraflagellar transport protein 52 [Portunus trituberculatus]|uniref:Intraflagellar transport protein 52 n=1 Tax=Portunus trituberculatus TaxID=210409 RepID=A0A5B7IDW4_PORTR|nr:Intraflagellar transport protein 52 [Portunus trituberculatus]